MTREKYKFVSPKLIAEIVDDLLLEENKINKEVRKTSIQFECGLFPVTWLDGSVSDYNTLEEGIEAIKDDFEKHVGGKI